MAARKPKSRMISIRLSDEEFTGLKQACENSGWANVSEIAREAMKNLLRGNGMRCASMELQVLQLAGQMDLLRQDMERLSRKLEAVMGGKE